MSEVSKVPSSPEAANRKQMQDQKPEQKTVQCISSHGYHDMAYREWGTHTSGDTVFCVHGLTRNNHDFDALAQVLSWSRRVVCPDLVGRGKSDWLYDPADYHLLQYNLDMTVLQARIGVDECDWIGTSLGGLMGIALAGMKKSPIRRLIVNDIAPEIPAAALTRVVSDIAASSFATLDDVEQHLRTTLAPFAPMTDADWAHMAATSASPTPAGYELSFDPGILKNFNQAWLMMHFNLWQYWSQIKCPVLVLHGSESDFLTKPLLEKMCKQLPHADVIEFEGVGHTPTLNAPHQIEPVVEWLNGN